MAIIDAEQRLSRTAQFNEDVKRQVRETIATLHNGLDQIESLICSSLDSQSRDIASAIGSAKPQPETIEQHAESGEHPARKPKLVKASAAGGEG